MKMHALLYMPKCKKKLRIDSFEQGTLYWTPSLGLFWHVQLQPRV